MVYQNWNVPSRSMPIPSLPASYATPPPRQPKRRKIAVACEECRARKVRCDGQRPVCGPCLNKAEHHGVNTNCLYSEKSSDRSGDRGRERTVNAGTNPQGPQGQSRRHVQTAAQSEHQGSSTRLFEGGADTSSVDRPGPAYHDLISPVSSRNVQPRSIGQQRQINSPIGVNAIVGEVAADERQPPNGFFGSSSAAGFMQQIKIAVNKKVPSGTPNTGPLLFPPLAAKEQPSSALSSMSNHVLPRRRMADHMMEIYWNIVFPLYPFFDKEQLDADYLRIWNGEESSPRDEDMLMCRFNVIFALGCQLSESINPEDRAAVADSFFSRAKDLLQFNLWQSGSTALIQCLLLMAQYLQSTDCADQCWMVTGMAIRSAQGLGLHLPETSAHLDSLQGKELARRIWHGCVLMDRVVALTLGRPAMISKEAAGDVPLPTMADEDNSDFAEPASSSNREGLSFFAFYAKSLELYEIMNDILLSVYKDQTPPDRPEDLQKYYSKSFYEGQLTVFQLDYALTSWSQSLPEYFSNQSDPSENYIINRQSVVLRLRFFHVRMVLLRPILSKYCDMYTRAPSILSDYSLPQRFALQCSIICVKSAQDLIDMVHTHLPPDDSIGVLPSWWYNILYIYTAATVLIAGLLHRAVLSELTEESVSQSWRRAIQILQKYQRYSSSAQRCIVALELLYEQVSSSSAAPAGSQHHSPAPHDPAHDLSLGEGLSAAVLDSFDMPEFFDMSWLNSVPSNLH